MAGDEGFTDPPAPAPDDEPETGEDEGAESSLTYGADGVTHFLAAPINVPGKGGMKTINKISFRRPTGADILDVGNPVIYHPGKVEITHDMQRMSQMIFRLSGISPAALAKMDPNDLVDCFWAITPFFIPSMLIRRT